MRKISAHYIFDGKELHKNAILFINSDGGIEDLQKFNNTIPEIQGVEFYNGIVCPGFINAHCHLELSHLHNHIPKHTALSEFISQVVSKRNVVDGIQDSIKKWDTNMYSNGIIAVGDISNNTDSFNIKKKSKILYHTFIELFDLYKSAVEKFDDGKQLFNEHRKNLKLSLSPHAPYSCSPKLMHRLREHAMDYEYPITIHNQEDESENSLFTEKKGKLYDFFTKIGVDYKELNATKKSSFQAFLPLLPEKNQILFVHNLYTSQQDINYIKFLRETDTFTFVLCPLSNLYIGNVLPPLELFMSNKINIAIGTDSLASNEQLSIIAELFCLQQNFPTLTIVELLRFATLNGAVALQIQNQFGSFKTNKKPGVILIENLDLQSLQFKENTSCKVLL